MQHGAACGFPAMTARWKGRSLSRRRRVGPWTPWQEGRKRSLAFDRHRHPLYALVQKTGMKNTRVVVRGGVFDFGFGNDFASVPPRKPRWMKRRNPFPDLFDRSR